MSVLVKLALALLPVIPVVVDDGEQVIAELKSSDEGVAKLKQVISLLEDVATKLKTALD